MSDPPPPTRTRPLLMTVIAIATVFSAAAIGNLATMPNIPTWYAGLVKPSFNPPNWLFGPVWGLLYLMMTFAFWRLLVSPTKTKGRDQAIVWFAIQMTLNALWSVAFFGLHNPMLGLIVIALMWMAIVITIIRFAAIDKLAAALLVPYLLWVSFASVLNASIWWLNRV